MGATDIGVSWVDCENATERRKLAVRLNRTGELATWKPDQLGAQLAEWQAVEGVDWDPEAYGFDPDEASGFVSVFEGPSPVHSGISLADRFGAPPFSVLNARRGYWQDRKRQWIGLGIQSEVGRTSPTPYLGGAAKDYQSQFGKISQATERTGFGADYDTSKGENAWGGSGTSIFDPVLTELLVSWFSPAGAHVLDPFAGGSVRGIVTAMLGRDYTGVDLRAEQVEANEAQWKGISADTTRQPLGTPTWLVGDSAEVLATGNDDVGDSYDMLLTCPPYGDLEVYSDDPNDLSTMDGDAFLATYRAIIAAAVARLREDSFAAIVVGDYRDKKGLYRNFVSSTIAAFEDAGARLYNEAILITCIGSLPIRAGHIFDASRKLGKTHQNVLVFVKGNPKAAADRCGDIVIDMHGEEGEA
jgi:hypothetical protein